MAILLDENNPEFYKKSSVLPDTKNYDIEDIHATLANLVPKDKIEMFEAMVHRLVDTNPQTTKEFQKAFVKLRKVYKCTFKKSELFHTYRMLCSRGEVESGLKLRQFLVKKAQKSQSGVITITVFTSAYPKIGEKVQKFSCKWNCYYCPNEPGQPRSYLHDEPGVLRANRNGFDAVKQFQDRAVTLAVNGHPIDKVELLVLGGTWASYPVEYQEEFIRDLFYAANTFFDKIKRERKSLKEEKKENETTAVKIIGLTLETRPDCINKEEIERFRYYGCTRVQLGIQHTDDEILKKINRGHTNQDAIRAIQLLRDVGYKMDIHLMPNLPGSSPETDTKMFNYVLDSPDLQADQWKIYPCEIVPWTVIKKWHDEGQFTPYPDDELIQVIKAAKIKVHPWIRLNRVVRDIPSQYILGGIDNPNLRQVINKQLIDEGTPCKCIRCREVRGDDNAINQAELVIRTYPASQGLEYFISFETPDRSIIFGFVRLRITDNAGAHVFTELKQSGLIRELHVYGQMIPTTTLPKDDDDDKTKPHAQHTGFGKRLMAKAEEIAKEHGKTNLAVISGVGVRDFYRKIGFHLIDGGSEMMVKYITSSSSSNSHSNMYWASIVAIHVGIAITMTIFKKR